MKITSVAGVTSIENVKCFKPVGKIFVKTIYDEKKETRQESDPLIRVRLVDGSNGSSLEIVPEMPLSILSEIASKFEGFQRKSHRQGSAVLDSYSLSSVILGQLRADGLSTAIDLSNDKYLDIDLRDLNPDVTYEIWGLESHIIDPFVRKYHKFYLSSGELEKNFSTGDNEVLVYPIDEIKELQMYAKNGMASPVFRKEELIIDEDGRNDLVHVELDNSNHAVLHTTAGGDHVLPVKFGYSKWGVMTISDFRSFDVRRDGGEEALTFLMIDTVPSII